MADDFDWPYGQDVSGPEDGGEAPEPPAGIEDLTPRQRQIVEMRVLHPEMSQAKIGRELKTHPNAVSQTLRKPQVANYLASLLDGAGARLEDSARVIGEAHEATTVKAFQHCGEIIHQEFVDHPTRMEAAKLNLRLRGELKEGASVQVNVYNELSDEQLAQVAAGQKSVADFIDVRPIPGAA